MVAVPDIEDVVHFFQEQELELSAGGEAAVLHLTEVEMETTRGRSLGVASVMLADVSWELSGCFIRAHSLRSSHHLELMKFTVDDQACRCRVGSLLAAADDWIHQAMDDDTAGDYATAEDVEQPEDLPPEEPPPATPIGAAAEVEMLKQRLAELEAQLQEPRRHLPGTSMPSSSRVEPSGVRSGRGVLFDGTPPATSAAGLQRLQQLAAGVYPAGLELTSACSARTDRSKFWKPCSKRKV